MNRLGHGLSLSTVTQEQLQADAAQMSSGIVAPDSDVQMANENIEAEEELKFALHPDDLANFLKLSRALQILIKHSLSNNDINNADTLLRE